MKHVRLVFDTDGNYSIYYCQILCGYCLNKYNYIQVIYTGREFVTGDDEYNTVISLIKLLYTVFMKDDTDEML